MRIRALGACHPDCAFCPREFWKWLRGNLRREMYAGGYAATSVRP